MKNRIIIIALITFCASVFSTGQEASQPEEKKNPRVIVTDRVGEGSTSSPSPTPRRIRVISSAPDNAPDGPQTRSVPVDSINAEGIQTKSLRMSELQESINEAKRQMIIKPLRISMSDTEQTTDVVRIAFYDWDTREVDYAVISKVIFLNKDSDAFANSEAGKWIRIKTIRGNGVNTPIMIFDSKNEAHLPLIVQYPIEKYGKFVEMAYYVSTHPGMVTPEAVSAGRLYVRNVLNTARTRLRSKGIFIQPKVADIAERLALVEHVDHWRFRNEYHPNIYNDVYMLYALNQGQTYRYSVSSAGAGGMVQMIPSTYRMIRSRYYAIGLNPDFVEGMRDHVNASEAMLLYMQMTWNELIGNSTVYSALESGIATQEQLMAAGYNSNPSRLPGYIRRGGANWTSLIPSETKVYLQIFESVEKHVSFPSRTE